ncbi:SpoIID/LytB domain-containing protein [Lyngbya confervoides]|uniref:SpoIID/LytB domain-containing protein n=1 Tax=Lyngbya confervoides BDU141951 TaxID=1574623 RepID=A0ABD4T6E0_9CYAN|nr:SpoIID/LytB domain-containing protein [Lyngbya confervoides]MCM1984125.1 SpoIID/LytB domain-containing protein [Lyngbya confervoides BDU141951]
MTSQTAFRWFSASTGALRALHPARGSFPKLLLGSMALLFLGGSPSLAREVRVAIQQNAQSLTVGSSTPAKVLDGTGQVLGTIKGLEALQAEAVTGAVNLAGKRAWQLVIVPEDESGLVFIGDRWYRGQARLIRTSDGFVAVNQVDLEDYLASVIGKEMYVSWPLEALKAQAVASRSYAIFKMQKPKSSLFDLLSTTTSQVYAGIESEAPSTLEATAQTRGQVLTYQGKVIEAVFHSASGGHTENSEYVWSSAVPYLKGVPDFDQEAPVFRWTANFTAAQMRQRLPGVGNVRALVPIQSSPTGRLKQVKIVGDAGSQVLSGTQLRKALGLKSTLIEVQPQFGLVAGQATTVLPTQFQISGRGYGHGIGMSQWGAHGMAQQGKTYQDIVQYYYRGTQIVTQP